MAFATVREIADLLGISAREVQRQVLEDGLPRAGHGRFDVGRVLLWKIRKLHAEKCGCLSDIVKGGLCEGAGGRSLTALQCAGEQLKHDLADVAPELAGLSVNEVIAKLTAVVDDTLARLRRHEERALERLGKNAWLEPPFQT